MASDKEPKAFNIERYFTSKVTVIHGYHSAMHSGKKKVETIRRIPSHGVAPLRMSYTIRHEKWKHRINLAQHYFATL